MAERGGPEVETDVEAALETNSVGVAVALDQAKDDPALKSKVEEFLDGQVKLIGDQRHHLREQLRHLNLKYFSERLKVALQLLTVGVGTAIVLAIAALIWTASHSNGLLIEPFSVPPDLVQRGVTGKVVAEKLLDRLAVMQAQTSSQRAPQTYANNWGQQDIKIDLPETGVSFTEMYGFLREKLGHDTHITGEIIRTPTGLALTARAGTDGSETVEGSDADLDTQLQQLSESVYRMTQPYRYAIYLREHDRVAEAIPLLEALGQTGSKQERAWGILGSALATMDTDGLSAAHDRLQKAVALEPDNPVVWSDLGELDDLRGRPEQIVGDDRKVVSALSGRGAELIRADVVAMVRATAQAHIDLQLADFLRSAAEQDAVVQSGLPGRFGMSARLARAQTGAHDLAAARATMESPANNAGLNPGVATLYDIWTRMLISSEAEDWSGVLAQAASVEPVAQKYPGVRSATPSTTTPLAAYAMARLGDMAGAHALIAATPLDCDECLRMRGRIAALQHDWPAVDHWFGEAVRQAPSIPFAYAEWGEALLAKGDVAGAITKLALAHQKGPKFADPLELWGEALMRRGGDAGALAKFAEADKDAPRWGRNHLRWGQALAALGRRAEAGAQFNAARSMNLSAADAATLAKVG